MQVMIGTTEAEVSDDGRDVRLPPPSVAKDALVLNFLQEGRSTKPLTDLAKQIETGSSALAGASAGAAPRIDLDGRIGTGLVLCLIVVAVVAARRFFTRKSLQSTPGLDEPLDEFAFLKRYGGATR